MTFNMFRQINQWFSISLSHISDSLWNIFDWIFQYSLKFNRLDLSNPLSHFLYRWYHFLKKRIWMSQFALGLIMKSTFGSSLCSLSVLSLPCPLSSPSRGPQSSSQVLLRPVLLRSAPIPVSFLHLQLPSHDRFNFYLSYDTFLTTLISTCLIHYLLAFSIITLVIYGNWWAKAVNIRDKPLVLNYPTTQESLN